MTYVAFSIWMYLILLAGMGLYRLWTRQFGHRLVDWILLPGTVCSELSYANGLLLLGRPAAGGIISTTGNSYAPGQVPTGQFGFFVSMFTSLLGLLGCSIALCLVTKWLGGPIMLKFAFSGGAGQLPTELPQGLAILGDQGRLLKFLGQTITQLDWTNWRTPVFIYLTICLAVRLGVVRHDWRAALVTNAVALGLLCGLCKIYPDIQGRLEYAWPLLTYVWTMLLSLLAITLVIRGLVDLAHIIRKEGAASSRQTASAGAK